MIYRGTNCPHVGDVNLHRHQESAETSHIYVCSHVIRIEVVLQYFDGFFDVSHCDGYTWFDVHVAEIIQRSGTDVNIADVACEEADALGDSLLDGCLVGWVEMYDVGGDFK